MHDALGSVASKLVVFLFYMIAGGLVTASAYSFVLALLRRGLGRWLPLAAAGFLAVATSATLLVAGVVSERGVLADVAAWFAACTCGTLLIYVVVETRGFWKERT